jgi:hypothetical protein
MLMTPVAIVLEIVFLVFVLLHLFQWTTQKADEPRVAENVIPFIGPIVQMMRYRSQFHRLMR